MHQNPELSARLQNIFGTLTVEKEGVHWRRSQHPTGPEEDASGCRS